MKATLEDFLTGRFCVKCYEALDPDDKTGTCCPECGTCLVFGVDLIGMDALPIRRRLQTWVQ